MAASEVCRVGGRVPTYRTILLSIAGNLVSYNLCRAFEVVCCMLIRARSN